ncbi:MAG: hypothetical protein U0736_09400 [Gemmataceae bacterium]
MIELTQEQRRDMDATEFPRVSDPETGQVYVLVPVEQYEKLRRLLDQITQRAGWDAPDMDDYEVYRQKNP